MGSNCWGPTWNHPFLTQQSIQIIGAPLVEGQNLEGADKAPVAIWNAGLELCSRKLGWEVKEPIHVNFKEVMDMPSGKENLARYQQWKDENRAESFSIWSAKNPVTSVPDNDPVEAIMSPKSRDPSAGYLEVKNSVNLGKGLFVLYEVVREAVNAGDFVLTLGGDHSIAAATITALTSEKYPDLAVVWVDAHADANTPATSPSLQYHGMPAAHILGWFARNPPGFEWFPTKPCVEEARFAYIGLRDIDKMEGELLRKSGIHVYTMRDVDRLGIATCIQEALTRIDPNCIRPLHLSVDIDAVDPQYAPGTGTLARGGLSYREVHYICEEMALTNRLVSMDLVEVNPALDPPAQIPAHGMHGDDPDIQDNTTPTVRLAMELCLSTLGKSIY
eukprot:GEMP01030342.1.p1 GENE.GEMP01030342.1~~GEMP01030342.1.p1  ORF type:complete len:389 (+),score=77.40 GEMP01030342.1:84-1250(+)